MASRILGMGDVLTLIEKAQSAYDEKKAKELEEKIKKNDLNLEDYLDQLRQMRNMGSLEEIMGMLPGVDTSKLSGAEIDEKILARTEAIVLSMTPKERRKPEILNASRKRRIAAGSGTTIQEVNRLLKQFEQTKQMMKQFSGGLFGKKKKGKKGRLPFGF
jgi:signal recognition particle subunit SRP54